VAGASAAAAHARSAPINKRGLEIWVTREATRKVRSDHD